MEYIAVFLVGGTMCLIGQILIDMTKLTIARILVIFVTAGVILTGLGWYEFLVGFGKSGATVPLPGFGYALAKGAIEGARENGFLGAVTGGLRASAAGITAALTFGYLIALIFPAKSKT